MSQPIRFADPSPTRPGPAPGTPRPPRPGKATKSAATKSTTKQLAPVFGSEKPRLFTEPLRKLTKRTTLGYEAIEFAENVLGITLLPWQKWWLIHALELDDSGGFRFRIILTLVGRQNGKTTLLKIIALWMMFMGRVRLVLGSAQSLDIAREAWSGAVDMAQGDHELRREIAKIRHANGEQELMLTNGARYKITAATRSAGRGLSVDLLLPDELREHRDWAAWAALSKTTMARPHALIVPFSNAGDEEAVVLNTLRSTALAGSDPSLALFEWSAPDDCELDDRQAWSQSNPGLGYTISESAIRSAMASDPPNVFRTEVLCQKVDSLDNAIDASCWKACADPAGSLANSRDRIVACLDVAPDGGHVTLAGAALTDDGRVRVEILAAWPTTTHARAELPDLLQKIAPIATAWFPGGPAAALAAELKGGTFAKRLGDQPPVEIRGSEVGEACQELADLVRARQILHPADPLLDAHVAGAQKLRTGDGWRFTRRGAGHVDAAYAVAGAVHAARTIPVTRPAPRSAVY